MTVLAAEPHETGANEDPEELRLTRAGVGERLRLEVERFGGTLEDNAGSGVVALFGATAAHEDDAERARYTAARLMCDLVPLARDAAGIVAVANQTAEQLETLGARGSAKQARQAAVTVGQPAN